MKKGAPVIIVCGHCFVEFDARAKNPGKGIQRMKAMKYCSRGCMAKHRAITHNQEAHHAWRGGVVNDRGYRRTNNYKGNGHRELKMEHIAIMEQHIGRKLNNDEVVHHKDRNRANNDIDNLQLVTRSEHSKLHYEAGDYTIGRYLYAA